MIIIKYVFLVIITISCLFFAGCTEDMSGKVNDVLSQNRLLLRLDFEDNLESETGTYPISGKVLYSNTSSKYATFDGLDTYVKIANYMHACSGTYAFWLKIDADAENYNTIFRFDSGSGTSKNLERFFMDYYNGNLILRSDNYDVSKDGLDIKTLKIPFDKGSWHHIAIFWDGNRNKTSVFMDGKFVGKTDYGHMSENVKRNLFIGSVVEKKGNLLKGSIDDFRVYSRFLTALELQELVDNVNISSFNESSDIPFINESDVIGNDTLLNDTYVNNSDVEDYDNDSMYHNTSDDMYIYHNETVTNNNSFYDNSSDVYINDTYMDNSSLNVSTNTSLNTT